MALWEGIENLPENIIDKIGALDGGSQMSLVDFKKRQYPLSLSVEFR